MTGFANKHFSTKDFPTNFIKQRYITLETPVKIVQKYHWLLLVVRNMAQTKIFCSLLPPLETHRNSSSLFLFGFFFKLFLIPSPLYLKISSNFFGGNYTLIISTSTAGQQRYTIFFHGLC